MPPYTKINSKLLLINGRADILEEEGSYGSSRVIFEIYPAHYPDVALSTAKEVGSGQNNVILLIGSDLIFSFPKYVEGIKQLKLLENILDGF
ncbi:hypothetical protein Bbad01_39420 [Bacillus badius]|nr:hypothetical protein Bbad01_39420 [Bacillus badius]